jgi:autotransporter adhesin
MNQIYKVVFSHVHRCFVAASELTKNQGKGSSQSSRLKRVAVALMAATALGGLSGHALAAPDGDGAKIQGNSVTASETNASAWGNNTAAEGRESTAWGYKTTASGEDATAWGTITKAEGVEATAWGFRTTASGEDATAWGVGTEASGDRATSWGVDTVASGWNSTTWGTDTVATSDEATAWGWGATASNEQATAWGKDTEAAGEYSTAWGHKTKAAGTNSTAWGSGTKAEGQRSTAWGHESKAEGENATSWGVSTKATGKNSTAWGSKATASGHTATAWGFETEASAKRATAWGSQSEASGEISTAFGDSSKAQAVNSLAALGGVVEASADNSAAIGKGAKATVSDTVALGSDSVASRAAGATDAYLKESSDTGNAWVSTHNAIAVGDDDNVTRQITGVAAGSKDTDAVNVAQLKKVADANTTLVDSANGLKLGTDNKLTLYVADTNGHEVTGEVDLSGLTVDTNTTYSISKTTGSGKTVNTYTLEASDGSATGEPILDTDTYVDGSSVTSTTDTSTGTTTHTVKLNDNTGHEMTSFKVTDTNTQSRVYHADSSKDYLTVTEADNSIGTKDYTVGLTDTASGAIKNASTFLNSSGFKAGDVTVTSEGFKVGTSGPSMTTSGIDAGGQVISNVKDGKVAKDSKEAVTGGQLYDIQQQNSSQDDALKKLAHRDAQLERKIYRAGAHAAAIAALHPLDYDEDHKFTAAAGIGQYHGSSAMAVGAFYRPTENLMFSVGASLNENDSMVNAGLSYRFGTGSGNKTSPNNIHEMKRQINNLSEENRQLAAQLNSSETKLAAESERSARLEAEINKIKKLLKLK